MFLGKVLSGADLGGSIGWLATHPPFGEAKTKKKIEKDSEYYGRNKAKHPPWVL